MAIHPSGYQCAISFVDKILIHHILHDELRVSNTIDLKSAYLIKYSTGGQYFFAIEQSTVHIYNAYTFEWIYNTNVPDPLIKSLAFSHMDKAFAVLGSQGYIGRWFTHDGKGLGA